MLRQTFEAVVGDGIRRRPGASLRPTRCVYGPVPMFRDRFDTNPTRERTDLSFRDMLARTPDIKDEWSFVWDETLQVNVACALQGVHFDVLLCNHYNVYYAPLQMKYKAALVYIASVAEAVLDYMVRMVQHDPRVQEVLGTTWQWVDFNDVPLQVVDLPADHRTIAGTQRKLQNVIDRNTKMQLLIRAAKRAEIVDGDMAKSLDDLRHLRNRIHIKTLDAKEYSLYSPHTVNNALVSLEAFRRVAKLWTEARHSEKYKQTIAATLQERAVAAGSFSEARFERHDLVEHATLGAGVVLDVAGEGDAQIVTVYFAGDQATRRLMVAYASLVRSRFTSADDGIPF